MALLKSLDFQKEGIGVSLPLLEMFWNTGWPDERLLLQNSSTKLFQLLGIIAPVTRMYGSKNVGPSRLPSGQMLIALRACVSLSAAQAVKLYCQLSKSSAATADVDSVFGCKKKKPSKLSQLTNFT